MQPAHIRGILENFVEIMMGVKYEDMKQPQFEGLAAMQFAELHEESIPTTSMMLAMCVYH